MQSGSVRLHLFASRSSLFALHLVGAGLCSAPTECAPKAPLSGADSPYQGEMSRRDKGGRDAGAQRLRGFRRFATAGCLRRPYLFRLAGKDRGEKGRLATFGASCIRIQVSPNVSVWRSTRYSPYGRLGTRRLIRWVSSLQLVALERLL